MAGRSTDSACVRHAGWRQHCTGQRHRRSLGRTFRRGAQRARCQGSAGCLRFTDPARSPRVSPGDVKAAWQELGSSAVVIKALVPGVAHKSEHGLVRLNVRTGEEAERVARELFEKGQSLGSEGRTRLLVQPMIAPVAELLVGARVDPEFGPVIVAGLGGIAVELFKDVAVRLAPVSRVEAEEMLKATRAAKLLTGWRGGPLGDFKAATEVICRVSHLIADLKDEVREFEINPLAVLPEGAGCLPLDCLLVRK
ncbi:MAG: hypothetical protein HC868_12845 [Sphingomonadales bacterium]|nr:hypothetical protein [Sphingomonadales bacterium]